MGVLRWRAVAVAVAGAAAVGVALVGASGIAGAAAAAAGGPSGSASAAAPTARVADRAVRLHARFDARARLGEPTAMRFGLRVDPRRLPAPVSSIRVRYPSTLGIATSGLGAQACRRPDHEFDAVIVDLVGLAGCSRNSVMGFGSAVARVQIGTLVIPATAFVTLLAGPLEQDRLRLVAFIDGMNPFGVKLLYGGELRAAAPPFGEDLTVRFPPMEGIPDDATFALVRVQFAIGTRQVVYRDRNGRRYRPDPITLPRRCPAGGFRFAAALEFEDGQQARATTTVPCPPRPLPAGATGQKRPSGVR